MTRRLPPLNALRAFEAAARHLSFTKAAAELNVTQAAVSHQVKGLEDRIGLTLFRRLNRALRLTDAGQAYMADLRDAFDRMEVATQRLRVHDASGPLTVSVATSFAVKWLVPRLARFTELWPDIDVRVSALDRLVDFGRDDVDVAIRYGGGQYPGMRVDRLLGDAVFPVCSLRLIDGTPPLHAPQDLQHHVLLHDMDVLEDWASWLKAAGVTNVDATRGPRFSHSSMVVEAAMAGQGVGLGRAPMVADDLAAGRLVRPFELSLSTPLAYYFVCPEATADRPKVVAFRDWLKREAEGEAAATGELIDF